MRYKAFLSVLNSLIRTTYKYEMPLIYLINGQITYTYIYNAISTDLPPTF